MALGIDDLLLTAISSFFASDIDAFKDKRQFNSLLRDPIKNIKSSLRELIQSEHISDDDAKIAFERAKRCFKRCGLGLNALRKAELRPDRLFTALKDSKAYTDELDGLSAQENAAFDTVVHGVLDGICSDLPHTNFFHELMSVYSFQDHGEIKADIQKILELVKNAQSSTLPAFTSLHQLPPASKDFTGRKTEKKELLKKAKSGKVAVCGLKGEGGVGKTALALVIAHELANDYPNAQLYIDLKGVDEQQQPVTPGEAISHFIRAWHPEAKLPDDDAALSGMYRSVLYGKRVLLLLDNAKDAEQVKPLLPPDGCLALVTSRQHFTLRDCYNIRLDMLPPKDASKLILKIAPRIGDKADDLAKACGYLPLALRLAASILADRADLSPSEYMDRLNNAKDKLKLIEASLSLSYDLLPPDQQRLWRMLGVFPNSFDAPGAAAVWEIDIDNARKILGELFLCSMVELESEGRWKLHDLSRVYAESKMDEKELAAVQYRHAEYYASITCTAEDFYKQGGESVLKGLALFDLERVNIETGQSWTAKFIDDDIIAKLGIIYALNAPNILLLRLHPCEQIKWHTSALHASQHLHIERDEAIALSNLGIAFDLLGECHRAIDLHKKSLNIAQKIGDPMGEAVALGHLDSKCIKFHEQSLDIARKIGNHRIECQSLCNLGNAYGSIGKYHRAIKFHEQSLSIARENGYLLEEANTLYNMSLAIDRLGKREQAIINAKSALEIFEQLKDPFAAKVCDQLAKWQNQSPDN